MSNATPSRRNPQEEPPAAAGIAPGGDMRQFVTFRVDDAIWGVPLGDVQEITRMPALVRVPRSSKSLEGLANLRGAVLPVASLRRLLRFADATPGDAARVVVLDRGSPIGFMVDGMTSLVSVAAGDVAPADSVVSGIDASMLQGVFKSRDGSSEIGILDPDALLRRDFGQRRQQGRALAKRDAAAGSATEKAAAPGADRNDLVLVSFELGRQEYALPLGRVREIVPLPDSISAIPRSDSAVLGVTSLRDELIPLLSLHALL
jgi:purine-binding chemotaxis protein CheW